MVLRQVWVPRLEPWNQEVDAAVVEAVVASVRQLVARLPDALRERVRIELLAELNALRVPPVLLNARGAGEDGTLSTEEVERAAEGAVEEMSQDPRVRRQTRDWSDERLRALNSCFYRVVLERLRALEGQDFGSKEAKYRAIRLVVQQLIAEVARDPARWLERNCKGE